MSEEVTREELLEIQREILGGFEAMEVIAFHARYLPRIAALLEARIEKPITSWTLGRVIRDALQNHAPLFVSDEKGNTAVCHAARARTPSDSSSSRKSTSKGKPPRKRARRG